MPLVGIHGQLGCRTDIATIIGYDKDDSQVMTSAWRYKVNARIMKTSFKSRIWNTTLSKYQTRHRNIKLKYNLTLGTGILGDSEISGNLTDMFKCAYFSIVFADSRNSVYNGNYVLLNEQDDLPDLLSNNLTERSFILRFEGGVNFFEESL